LHEVKGKVASALRISGYRHNPLAPVRSIGRPMNASNPIPTYFNDDYCRPGHWFETLRKAALIAEKIRESAEFKRLFDLRDPAESQAMLEAAVSEIERYVKAEYLHAIRTGEPDDLAESNFFPWDEGIYAMVINSTAGILSALRDVRAGARLAVSLSSGLHHATPWHGDGYCTVNSLAIAALVASREGAKTVILDLDGHCGGGTNAFLHEYADDARLITHVDLSTKPFDMYPDPFARTWSRVVHEPSYLAAVGEALEQVGRAQPDVVLYNAGIDFLTRNDWQVVARREQLVAKALGDLGVGCVAVLAGGYGDIADVADGHLVSLSALATSRKPNIHAGFKNFSK
jgi:acetoin utilization deacetylase AcuC-like enzyme